LKVEKAVDIGRFSRLKCSVGERENFVLDVSDDEDDDGYIDIYRYIYVGHR